MKTLIDALYDKDNNRFIVNYIDDIGDKKSTLFTSASIFAAPINDENGFSDAFQAQLDLLPLVKPRLQYITYKATKFNITVEGNKLPPKIFDTSDLSEVITVTNTGGKTQKQVSDNLQNFILSVKGVPLSTLLSEIGKKYVVINGEMIAGVDYDELNDNSGTILFDSIMLMIDLYNS